MRKIAVSNEFWLQLAELLKPEERHTYRDEGGLILFTPNGETLWFKPPESKPRPEAA